MEPVLIILQKIKLIYPFKYNRSIKLNLNFIKNKNFNISIYLNIPKKGAS